MIQSVDSLKLATAISDEAKKQGIVQKILLQVNNANEESKTGFSVDEIRRDFKEIISLDGIQVEGLMNIAPIADDETLCMLFAGMRDLKTELENNFSYPLKELSMGMSSDYKLAVRYGSTMIRIGRKLFI